MGGAYFRSSERSIMASSCSLIDIPENFCNNFICDKNISLKCKQQAFRYFAEGYLDNVFISCTHIDTCGRDERDTGINVELRATCYRSQRTKETPHQININSANGQNDAHCTCQAG